MSTETHLNIDGMTCDHCRRAVEEALQNVAGVRSVEVHLDSGIANVTGAVERKRLVEAGIVYETSAGLTDEDIVRKYQECDIVSFVSTHEGFGMPIVEAQCVERAVVTSNCSSMPEVAGDGACLVDPYDIESIRNGFRRVITDADFRATIIERGRQNRVRFDERQIASTYQSIYESLWKREKAGT